MIVLSKQAHVLDILLGPHTEKVNLKKSRFNFIVKYNDLYLLHNTFSKAFCVLNSEEFEWYDKIKKDSHISDFLIQNGFFVDNKIDELSLFEQVHITVDTLESSAFINNFTIFTTTKCNARCFYCFESGINKYDMTEKTAYDTVDYIVKVSNGEKVGIRWFGGEPLCNCKAIDIISDGLAKCGISFDSAIISNGYLFDEKIIYQAKNRWNLKYAQITIDGTEENYNRIKNYIHNDVISPYKKVIKNIEDLLINDIGVNVQINLYEKNFEDAFILVNELIKKFSRYSKFKIVPSYLVDSNWKKKFTEDETIKQFERFQDFKKYLFQKDILKNTGLNLRINGNKCMANDDHSTFILPNGDLAKCDMNYEGSIYASIYSNNVDKNVLDLYRQKHDFGELCYDCIYLPNCAFLKNCPNSKGFPCDKNHRDNFYDTLKFSLIEEYKKTNK